MILDVYVEDTLLKVEIPQDVLEQGTDFFDIMDRDMNQGRKLGPAYVQHPGQMERVQIAADKMLVAIDTENRQLLQLLAGYIVTRLPGVTAIRIATDGNPLDTEIIRG